MMTVQTAIETIDHFMHRSTLTADDVQIAHNATNHLRRSGLLNLAKRAEADIHLRVKFQIESMMKKAA